MRFYGFAVGQRVTHGPAQQVFEVVALRTAPDGASEYLIRSKGPPSEISAREPDLAYDLAPRGRTTT